MKCVILLYGYPGRVPFPSVQYLKAFDVEAHDGRGECDATGDLAEAMVFDSYREASAAWQTQSVKRPLREDGQPNRPLTAFTIEVVPVKIQDGDRGANVLQGRDGNQ